MNILVTGGLGFIGRNLIYYLLKKNYKVLNIDNLTYASKLFLKNKIIHKNYHFQKIDIKNYTKLEKIIFNFRPNKIINLAAESHVDNSIINPNNFILTNINGTFNLLQISLKYWNKLKKKDKEKFLYYQISTDEVYGYLKKIDLPFTEKSIYNPSSPYAASKASADMLVKSWNRTYNFPTIISNCSNNYGPWQHTEKLIPKTILCCLKNIKIPIYGSGKQIRDWIHVEDHIKAIYKIMKMTGKGQSFNIGSNNEIENIKLVKHICNYMNSKLNKSYDLKKLIDFVDDRPGHDFRYSINNSKLKKYIKWNPNIEFYNGLEKTIDWYLEKFKRKNLKLL